MQELHVGDIVKMSTLELMVKELPASEPGPIALLDRSGHTLFGSRKALTPLPQPSPVRGQCHRCSNQGYVRIRGERWFCFRHYPKTQFILFPGDPESDDACHQPCPVCCKEGVPHINHIWNEATNLTVHFCHNCTSKWVLVTPHVDDFEMSVQQGRALLKDCQVVQYFRGSAVHTDLPKDANVFRQDDWGSHNLLILGGIERPPPEAELGQLSDGGVIVAIYAESRTSTSLRKTLTGTVRREGKYYGIPRDIPFSPLPLRLPGERKDVALGEEWWTRFAESVQIEAVQNGVVQFQIPNRIQRFGWALIPDFVKTHYPSSTETTPILPGDTFRSVGGSLVHVQEISSGLVKLQEGVSLHSHYFRHTHTRVERPTILSILDDADFLA